MANDTGHLSGQQMARLQEQVTAALRQTVNDMNLRKWAIDTAAEVVGDTSGDVSQLVPLAMAIFEFTIQPALILASTPLVLEKP